MTTPMFDLNQEENDRLLLNEEDRRRELIERAVSSFAPTLAGKSGVKAIHLYSTNATIRKWVRDTLGASKTIIVEHCGQGKERKGVNEVQQDSPFLLKLPEQVDLMVTKTSLNFRNQIFAAQLNAMPVVIPEGEGYIRARLDKQGVLVIVGADQGRQP